MKKEYHLNDVTTPNATGMYQNDLDDPGPTCFFRLFRFATKLDLFLIFIGLIVTLIKSTAMPFLIVTYGEFTTLLVDRTKRTGTSTSTLLLPLFGGGKILMNATLEDNRAEIVNDSIAFGILLSIVISLQLISGVICVDTFNHAALRQITRIRIRYFQSLMRQEIGWYDVAGGSNNFAVRLTEDIEKIRNGIGEKVSHFFFLIFGFLICLIMSFIYGWKLALTLVSYIPIVTIAHLIISKLQASLTAKETNAYAEAANVAEEVFGGIRTVFAFCGEKNEIERYNQKLMVAKSAVKRKGLLSGIGDGLMRFLFFASNAIGFWYGVQLVLADRDKEIKEYTPAVLMITFFGLISGADSITRAAPFLEAFASAQGSASTIFRIIDRASKIDSMSSKGKTINANFNRNITFKNVSFSYPSRVNVQILRDLNLNIQSGDSVALVGHSGNGKSTCLQLLQRFYDPDDGQVIIGDVDIRSLNLNVLRSCIATVGQEPVLFSTTIAENIRFGNPNATDTDIIAAAQQSGAHDFISKFPQGYNTLVGEKGSQMSGGQKQRIAIARALIQNPTILLLDEATSALDYQSEKYVQETLNRASKGRTTIVVSHRLSAIRSADRIIFIDKGQVVEDGTHNELIAMKGNYYKMIMTHNFDDDNDAIETQVPTVNELHEMNSNGKLNDKQLFHDHSDGKNLFGSISVDEIENNNESKKTKTPAEAIQYWKVFKRVFYMMKSDWFIMLIAAISAIAIGAALPVFAVLFAEVYGALSLEDSSEVFNQTLIMCVSFFIVGVILFIAAIPQTFFFMQAGIGLSIRARSMAFASMLRQECAWFDEEDNSVGALSTRLTGDAGSLQGAIGFPLSIIIQSLSTFFIGIIISSAFSLKLVMVCLSVMPLSLITVIYETRQTSKTALMEKTAMENGSKIAAEAITNIRTVASLRQEKHMLGRYVDEMMKLEKIVKKLLAWRGLADSVAQSIPIFGYAITLCYGGLLVARGEIHFKNVLKTTESLMYGTMVMSQTLVFVPAITAAFVGAHRMFKTIDRMPQISSPDVSNKVRKPDKGNDIEYKKIDFRYPTRPDVQILNDFSLHIHEGKTIALVGTSGCGKSTCIQLLQRLYDPEHGRVYIGLDEVSNDISLKELRSKLSIVSQEPVLFDKTIAQNIAYGDNSRDISLNEIIDAAKIANVHNFIVQLPQGYETSLGSKGAQLSGGQKQRIAIARAIIRNPKILLLDEATSALDLQSELVVQQALDAVKAGRTCIIIAHRLSTVQNADAICVLRNGTIVEYGTHTELLSLGGVYTRLYNAQK